MSIVPGSGADAPSVTVEQRSAPRRLASAVPSITRLRLSPRGGEATLINISSTGLLAECGERVQIGSNATVAFEGGFSPRTVQGRVARNSVASMGANGRLRYHVGIAFNTPIDLGVEPAPEVPAVAAAPPPEPVPEPAPPPPAAAPQILVNRW
jgi:PilZ domain-containing protein